MNLCYRVDMDSKEASCIMHMDGELIPLDFDTREKIILIEAQDPVECECCGMKVEESRVEEMIFFKKSLKACGFSLENRQMKMLIKKMNQFLNGSRECLIEGYMKLTDYKVHIGYCFVSTFPMVSFIVIDYNDYSKVSL